MDKTLISVLAGLGGMFGWGTSDFFANLSSDKIGHLKTFFWSQLAGIVFVIFLIPFFGLNLNLPLLIVALLFIASIFYATGYLLFYKAFEIGNVSIVASIVNIQAIVAMFTAIVFMGQKLNTLQAFAVFLVLSGVTLVSINFNDFKNKKLKLLSGVKETLLASIFFGLFWNLSEFISEKIGWLPTTFYIKLGAILLILVFSFFAKKKLKLTGIDTKTKLVVVLIGILEALAVVSVNYGLEFGDLVLVLPISSAVSIVKVLMALIFLKEKITKVQTLGIVITITGIILTSL